MSAPRVCPACARPVRDNATLCGKCVARLEQNLAEVQALADEVETTRLRQSRTGGQAIGGGHSSDRPLPYDDRPAVAAKALLEVLARWARLVVEQRGVPVPRRPLLPELSRFLLGHLEWLRHRDEAPQLLDEVLHAVGRVRASVDRRAERVYAGPCGAIDYWPDGHPILCSARCDGDVYGRPTAKTATCQRCGAVHDVAERREWLLAAVEDQLAHGALLSKALSNLGRPVPEATFRSWVARGRLVPHSKDEHGRDVYRVGDVLDVIKAEAQRQAELAAKRAGGAVKRTAC